MKPIDLPVGTAAGVGSLPHRHLDAAVSVTLAASPELPTAPSLPRLDPREGMLGQAADGMAGVAVTGTGALVLTGPVDPTAPFGPGTGAGELDFDGPAWGGLRAFLHAVCHRTGPVKLQLTGPVTLGIALAEIGVPVADAFAAAATGVRLRASALIRHVAAVAPGVDPYVFIDEPCLISVSRPGFPLAPDRAVDLMSSALAAVEAHAVTGLHCCGAADWRLALGAGPQILSLPVDPVATTHAGALGAHLDRGGWLAWGAVPTAKPTGDLPGPLWRALSDTWCELVQRGCDPLRLREQALVTPECGLATHDPVRAEHLLALAADLAERVRRQSFGVRLSVGA